MRAMKLHAQAPIETAPLRCESVEPLEPGPGEVLVRVGACATCRTDLHVVEGDLPLRKAPVVPGHQVVGRVERAGRDAIRFATGDRVGVAWLRQACGVCTYCRSDRENLCERPDFTGWTHDGGYADHVVVPEGFAYAIPAAFDDATAAPLLCAGIIGHRALRLAAVPAGGRLGIWGFGSSAHVTIQIARARGVEVHVVTRGAERQQHARTLGASWAGGPGDELPTRVDGGIVFAPAGEIVPEALRWLAPGATLALAGIYMSEIPGLPYARLFEERVLRTVTANTRADGEELLAEAARIPVLPAVTRFALEDANRALGLVKRGAVTGTAVLVMTG